MHRRRRPRHRDRGADRGPRRTHRWSAQQGKTRPMTTDQRQHPRYAIELDAEITVGGVAVADARTISRAAASACWRTGSVPVGATGEVKLALVFSETEFSEHLTLPANDRMVHADERCLSDRREVRAARPAASRLSRSVHQVPRRGRRRRTTTRRSRHDQGKSTVARPTLQGPALGRAPDGRGHAHRHDPQPVDRRRLRRDRSTDRRGQAAPADAVHRRG